MSDDFRWINIGTNKWSGTFDGKAAVLRDLPCSAIPGRRWRRSDYGCHSGARVK
jgi:hypothetical protein